MPPRLVSSSDTARLEFRPWAQAPVLMSDAAASARATEKGICHLQAACYPRAAVYGHAYERLKYDKARRSFLAQLPPRRRT